MIRARNLLPLPMGNPTDRHWGNTSYEISWWNFGMIYRLESQAQEAAAEMMKVNAALHTKWGE